MAQDPSTKAPAPNLRTPREDLCKEEANKLNSGGYRGQLETHFQDLSIEDIVWESEQLAKSHGIYLEFNRDKTGTKKEWMYMMRFSIPGGGPLNREQWRLFDECAEQYTLNQDGKPSLRLTTRQNIQFHWVKKSAIRDIVQRIAQTRFYSLNGCGDNTRNVMGCPLSCFSTLYNSNVIAQRFGQYFRLPIEPHLEIFGVNPDHERTPEGHFHYGPNLLNRKFKIAFSAIHFDETTGQYVPDNCVECRTDDIGVAPILDGNKVERFQVYIGGGQGERNGKPTFAALGQPFGILHEQPLLEGLDAIVRVHQEWGDRQNRHWARLKYVVHAQGIAWYRDQVRALIGDVFEPPDEDLDIGPRHLHHGWIPQPSNGLWAFGAFIENGRIINGLDGELKTMVRYMMDNYPVNLMITPNQDLLFTDISADAKTAFEADLRRFGYGRRNGQEFSTLRKASVACVGLPTCRLAYTDSEQFLPELIDELDKRGWGEITESLGVSGCERQCSRPATKTIGWVGSRKDGYLLKLMGTEDGRNQGKALMDAEGKMYLRFVPREEVANVTEALLEHYRANHQPPESMGYFHQRVGMQAILDFLKEHPKTAMLLAK
jgi:sulfite reductase beta subunit-like hemoprotein